MAVQAGATGNPYVPGADAGAPGGGLLRVSVAAGVASGSLIEVTGMQREDTIVAALQSQGASGYTDRTGIVSGLEAGGFRTLGATDTPAGSSLIVVWLDKKV
jgi:hypothetical protein